MDEINVDELFTELIKARFMEYPYVLYPYSGRAWVVDWESDKIWLTLLDRLFPSEKGPCPVTCEELKSFVKFFEQTYDSDNSLSTVTDLNLKNKMKTVFGPLHDNGPPQIKGGDIVASSVVHAAFSGALTQSPNQSSDSNVDLDLETVKALASEIDKLAKEGRLYRMKPISAPEL